MAPRVGRGGALRAGAGGKGHFMGVSRGVVVFMVASVEKMDRYGGKHNAPALHQANDRKLRPDTVHKNSYSIFNCTKQQYQYRATTDGAAPAKNAPRRAHHEKTQPGAGHEEASR